MTHTATSAPRIIYRSPLPDAEIPDVSLTDHVFADAARFGNRAALIDGPSGRTLTYAELATGVRRAAAGLAARGFRKGDVCALYCPNIPEYPLAFHAVASLGGINTTANPLASADDLERQLGDSGASVIITVPQLLPNALAAARRSRVRELFVIGEGAGATPFAELLQTEEEPPRVAIGPGEDVVALPYSSGTTGLPKGVMLTHRNLVANLVQCAGVDRTTEDDVVAGVIPFFHIYGMVVIANAVLCRGATVVTMPQFEFEGFLRILQDYRVTRAFLVPPIILGLAKHPAVETFDLSTLRLISSGAAPLGASLAEACAARLRCVVKQGYGMTETSPVTHTEPEDPALVVPGAVGLLVANTLCRVVDIDSGADLPPNRHGELLIKGPQVMKGYLNHPEATAACLSDDGWLRTGDIGYVDDDGHFFVVDRLKEFIKYKGYQVAPAELEAVLLTHPAVADAAVIPSADAEAGEVPKACVVLKPGFNATTGEIMEFVSARVARYKKLREVEFIERVPKSSAGKILRRELIERERARQKEKETADIGVRTLADRVTVEQRGHVLLIGLARPRKLNAFDLEMLQALSDAYTELEDRPELRCGVLFAHGGAFTSGLDLASVGPAVASRRDLGFGEGKVDIFNLGGRLRTKPLVAAAHGLALTIGIELLLAADVRLAGSDARFAQIEVQRGIFPFGGATIRLPEVAGWGNAMRYLLTGDEFDAAEALRIGLVQEVVEPAHLLERAIALAERIAAQAPLGVRATIESARTAQREGPGAAAAALQATVRSLMESEDAKEGMRSFVERRAATFEGK
jgi:acyl-CoA synthetase (AMP-forming)/AMP-acid ligase II/enoyl-CoA hydratase/carnithine racemase